MRGLAILVVILCAASSGAATNDPAPTSEAAPADSVATAPADSVATAPADSVATAPADSAPAAPDSVAAKPPPHLTLRFEHGLTRNAIYIEPRSDGMAAVTATDGTKEYIPLYKIERIEDASGADQTSEVVRRGHHLGVVPKPAHEWKRYRSLAGPRSACGSYAITDFALMWRIDSGTRNGFSRKGRRFVSMDYGYARNVGDASSIGASAFLGMDEDLVRSGIRLRVVRWLKPNLSLDVAPGVVLLANEVGYARFKGPGFSSQAGLTFAGRLGLVAQVASVTRVEPPVSYLDPDTTVHETSWHVGVRLGGAPGIVGTLALAGLLAIALGSLGG